jgi:hypothetical protein
MHDTYNVYIEASGSFRSLLTTKTYLSDRVDTTDDAHEILGTYEFALLQK